MNLHVNEAWFKNIPELSTEEYTGLEYKIITEGFRDPIVVWHHEGIEDIVSGRNRYAICQHHNITPITSSIEFKNESEAIIWIVDEQLSKRNISEYTKFELLDEKYDILRQQGKDNMSQGGKNKGLSTVDKLVITPIDTREEISYELGKSTGHVAKLNYVRKHADEDTKNKLRNNKVAVDKIYKEIKNKEYKKSESIKKDVSNVIITNNDVKLYNNDILDAPIEDNSIDIIITDPPYPREYLDCWSKLAQFAVKKLKPNGVLIAMSGQSYLPQVYNNMNIEGLNYYWTGCIYTPGISPNLQTKRLRTNWKPLLCYVKGDYKRTFQHSDVYISKYDDTANGQKYHKWGQSYDIFDQLVKDYSYKDSVVCDPFLGGATTAIACIKNKRKFIGIELDLNTYNIASKRISEVIV